MNMTKQVFIPLLLIFVSLSWAGSFIVVAGTTNEISPLHLGFLRFAVATPLMVCLLLIQKKPMRLPLSTLPSIIVLGLSGVTLLYIFQFTGIHLTTPSTGAVLINTNVIFIALLSAVFLHERFTWKKSIGIGMSFLGVASIMLSTVPLDQLSISNTFFFGSILVLVSALCWAIYSIVGKSLLQTYDEFTIITYSFLIGTLFYIPLVFPTVLPTIQTMSLAAWTGVLYLAVICSLFAYVGWYYALKRIEATKAAVFLNLIPLFTMIMAVSLGEQLTWWFIIGAILIISGVYVTQQAQSRSMT